MLVLEDLHWSDPSTLELLSFIARRQQPARLLVLGSYRPMEVLTNGRPLRAVAQELALHRHCEEAPLGLLNESDIRAYLSTRFPVGEPVRPSLHSLARLIHRRTEGNPLFMVNVVDDLLAQGGWNNPEMELNMPATIRQMIERQFDHLTAEEQQVVAVASVAGMEFSTAVVAAGIEAGVPEVEMRCADLVRREHFLRASGVSEWPDGTIAARYAFRHALYQEVVYERVPAGRRVELHRRVGERLEAAYGERATEVATELAVHFERGRDIPKAVHYHGQAGQRALQRSASQEAITHLTTALELLSALPDTPERTQQELALQMALGPAVEC